MPVLLFRRALKPNAELVEAVLERSALAPMAEFEVPVLLKKSASAPKAALLRAVVL